MDEKSIDKDTWFDFTINNVSTTQEQYQFLHIALIESLMLSSSALPASSFLDVSSKLMTYDDKARCLGIRREFEVWNVKITGEYIYNPCD